MASSQARSSVQVSSSGLTTAPRPPKSGSERQVRVVSTGSAVQSVQASLFTQQLYVWVPENILSLNNIQFM